MKKLIKQQVIYLETMEADGRPEIIKAKEIFMTKRTKSGHQKGSVLNALEHLHQIGMVLRHEELLVSYFARTE